LSKPLVSVVVPAKNSEATIGKCLESIENQTFSNIEIIVVDNFSGDKTREIAQRYGRVFTKGPERSAQRNLGAKCAGGDYLFFIDSDMELRPEVVEECVKEALEKEYHAVVVPEISVGEGFWTRCKALERSCYVGDETIEAARFFRKDVFFEVGGYDEKMTGQEDWDLHQMIKKRRSRIGRINAFILHYEGRLTLRKTMVKKHAYGKTLKLYRVKHSKEADVQLRLIRPAFIRNWRMLAKDPVHTAGMLFMKTTEFVAGWFGSLSALY
jgi:glycosyltransferase involved in cell wall biosynthesis